MVKKTAAFGQRRAADTARWRERLHQVTGRLSGLHDRKRQRSMPARDAGDRSTSRRDRLITEHARPHASSAQEARYRRRLRDGVCVLSPQVKEAEFAEALMLAGRLTDRQALRRDQLTREAESILAEFTDRWLRHQP
jgi:hypothetical protein